VNSDPGAGYLGLYLRDMRALGVLSPEEELAAARDIEARELALWQELLAYEPTAGHIAHVLPGYTPGPNSIELARRDVANALRLRKIDPDRQRVTAALDAVDVIEASPWTLPRAVRGSAALADWIRAVRVAERASKNARNDFVKANLRLVISIAKKFNPMRMSLADMIQEGNIGLMRAVERFDWRRGFRFSTYATWWIRHAISRALVDKAREIRLPLHMISANIAVTKARAHLAKKLDRLPTTEEIASATKLPVEKVDHVLRLMTNYSVSIDQRVADDDEGDESRTVIDELIDPDREQPSPLAQMEQTQVLDEVMFLLRELPPIEADILRKRFGLETEQELTLEEIGERHGLSRERIRQLQLNALDKLRRALRRKDMM
jgi:RNA polymerase primary sigma factor